MMRPRLLVSLRAMVGQTLGLPLDGKYRLHIDRALSKLAMPQPSRVRRCFTIVEGSVRPKETLEEEVQG